MPKRKKKADSLTFQDTLREALEHFNDLNWLEQFSPLATPYFLGQYLQLHAQAGDIAQCGRAFQLVVRLVATEMWGAPLPTSQQDFMEAVDAERLEQGNKGPRYYFYLLELRYLRQIFSPNTFPIKVFSIPDFVNVSSTRFFIHLEKAVAQLGHLMLQHFHPTFRLEQPRLNQFLVGREKWLNMCLTNLQQKRLVAVSGPGGIGKTTLGVAIAEMWPDKAIFWFTIRLGLNNQLSSLLFALGHFLKEYGQAGLWQYLIINSHKPLNPTQALGFLRNDLAQIHPITPLFCFDETDLLQSNIENEEHIRIIELLESLRGSVPILLLGQRSILDADQHYVLAGLTSQDITQLLQTANIHLSKADLVKIQTQTQGNPRLLELLIALYHLEAAEDPALLLENLAAPSVRALLNRLWKRLGLAERRLLNLLSIFRSVAPEDVWADEQAALDNLVAYHLVQVDQQGGLTLLPYFRALIYADLLPQEQAILHQQVAEIRGLRGEYTAAAYHYIQGGNTQIAIQLWYTHREQEIQRGQADVARTMFEPIPLKKVNGQTRKQLKLLQNQLHEFVGDAPQMLAHMKSIYWPKDDPLTAEAHQQQARAHAIQGNLEVALQHYESTLETLTQLNHQLVQTRYKRGQLYIQLGEASYARQEANIAQYEVERLRGVIEFFTGNVHEAITYFTKALQIAETVKPKVLIAYVQHWLTLAYGQKGDLDQAKQYAKLAIAYFQQIGDRVKAEGIRADLAGMHNQVAKYTEAIPLGETALRYFEGINHQPWIATICSNLAEAYLETDQLESAKQYAYYVLQLEDAHARPHALYTLGLALEREGDTKEAETYFQQGIQTAQQNDDKMMEAYLQRVSGELLTRLERPIEAETALHKAVQLFELVGLTAEAEKTTQLLT